MRWLESGLINAVVLTLPAPGLLTRELGPGAGWAVLPGQALLADAE